MQIAAIFCRDKLTCDHTNRHWDHCSYCETKLLVVIKLTFLLWANIAISTLDVVFKVVQITNFHRTDNERSYNDAARYVRFQESRDVRRIPVRGNHGNRYEEVFAGGGPSYNDRNYHYQQQRNAYYQRPGGGGSAYAYNVVCYSCGRCFDLCTNQSRGEG